MNYTFLNGLGEIGYFRILLDVLVHCGDVYA